MSQFVRAELRARRRMLAGLAAGAFVLLLIFGTSYESLGLGTLGTAFAGRTPKVFTAFAGTPGVDILSPAGWIGFGFNHPLFIVLTLTAGIAVAAGSIAGEVESGRGELLFTAPVARTAFLDASLLVWLAAELVVLAGGWLGALVGALTSDKLHSVAGALIWAPLQCLPLALFFASCAFVASAATSSRGRATSIGAGIAALAYLVNVVSGLIGSLGWLRWTVPFGYYEPAKAIDQGLRILPAAGLVLISVTLLLVARMLLMRRDLA